jgi:NhaP-type Na+/H+ or K+/H+ antiporter
MWSQLEPTAPHLTYTILSCFLIIYALFSQFIRNRLHFSEPPLAVLIGIIFGPFLLNVLTPRPWGLNDEILQETTRVIVGVQCFAVGIDLPKLYFNRHWKSVAVMLGPVMAFGWVVSSLFAYLIFKTSIPTALIIGACLSPTDPVLAASVLAKSQFSDRVPKRIKHVSTLLSLQRFKTTNRLQLLAAESACNDGVSFPFLYLGLVIFKESSAGEAFKEWFLITILWQCILGLGVGLTIGRIANRVLRFSDEHKYISKASFVVFYLLLAILAVGVGSTLGLDDFLVAFGAGIGFAHDGWFAAKTKRTKFPVVIDLLLNSTMFVYFGAMIPWHEFSPRDITPNLGIWQLLLFSLLVLLFRRIPVMLAVKSFTHDIKTYREALFCGHFGPMGLGALFLAMEARAQLETGTSLPLPEPPPGKGEKARAIALVWPVVCFMVLSSTFVHGLSVVAISLGGHYSRKPDERSRLLGGETDDLDAMDHNGGGGDSEPSVSGTDSE